MSDSEQKTTGPAKAVYTIVDGSGGKKYWLRVGRAYVNRDGSMNVVLDAVPVNGTLHIRDEASAPSEKQA